MSTWANDYENDEKFYTKANQPSFFEVTNLLNLQPLASVSVIMVPVTHTGSIKGGHFRQISRGSMQIEMPLLLT